MKFVVGFYATAMMAAPSWAFMQQSQRVSSTNTNTQAPRALISLPLFAADHDVPSSTSRKIFVQTVASAVLFTSLTSPAGATGRATLEQAYRRYAPRIRAGGEFYQNEFKALVKQADWQGIQDALREVPDREKGDLNKPDAGVAARARQAGGFSDARVLVAADLFASAFSNQNSISTKTKNMKEAVAKLRATVAEMDSTTKEALGQGGGGGLFGLGKKKKVNESELIAKMRKLYAEGGNFWNEYVFAANEELALQFDKFEYIR